MGLWGGRIHVTEGGGRIFIGVLGQGSWWSSGGEWSWEGTGDGETADFHDCNED